MIYDTCVIGGGIFGLATRARQHRIDAERLTGDELREPRILHVCNAPSPAATSALPIGEMIAAKLAGPAG